MSNRPTPFGALAYQLARAQVPAVIAMQTALTIDAGAQLLGDLLSALAQRCSVQQALGIARANLYANEPERVSWFVPVLVVRSRAVAPYYLLPPLATPAADAPAADPAPPLPHVYPPAPSVIGHADVVGALYAQWQRAQDAAQRPYRRQVVVLTSKSGYGRRALLDELAAAQTEAGGCVLRLVFAPDDLPTEPPHEPVVALHARTAALWPRTTAQLGAAWPALLAQIAAVRGELPLPALGLRDAPSSLRTILAQLDDAPLLIVEQIEHAPPAWLKLLEDLAGDHERGMLAISLTLPRPLEQLTGAQRGTATDLVGRLVQTYATELHWLDAVTPADVRAWIGSVDARVAQQLCDLADGIPTIIASLWDLWCADDVVVEDANGIVVFADGPRDLVATEYDVLFEQLLAHRAHGAPIAAATLARVLELAAQEGQTFTVQVIAQLCEIDVDDLLDVFDDYLLATDERPGLLVEAENLRVQPSAALPAQKINRYRFAHPFFWHVARRDSWRITHAQRIALADALLACYPPLDMAMIRAACIELYEVAGAQDRASSLRRVANQETDRVVDEWQIAVLDARIAAAEAPWVAAHERDTHRNWRRELGALALDRARLYALQISAAEAYQAMGAYTDSERLAWAVLDRARAYQEPYWMGEAAYQVASSMYAQGRYNEAHQYSEEARRTIDDRELRRLPRVLTLQALIAQTNGDLGTAHPLLERALQIYETTLGPQHPNTATSLNNLAGLLDAQGTTKPPARCTNAPWRSGKPRSARSTPIRPKACTIWPSCWTRRGTTKPPARCTNARSRSMRPRSARSIPIQLPV